MVEPAPAPPLVVAQPHLLLELLEIPFDAPAQLGLLDQVSKRRVRRQGREPVFRRLLLPLRSLDQDPFLSSGLMQQVIAVGRPDPHGGKARRERRVRAFPPGDRLPSLNRQALGEIERRDRLVIAIAPHPRGTSYPRSST